MEEAAERPEEQARTTPRRQDAQSGSEVSGNAQDMGMGALLEQYEESQHTQLRRGELVEGTVVLVDRDEILVDIGGKMEAVIATSEIQNERGEPSLQRGDHVSADGSPRSFWDSLLAITASLSPPKSSRSDAVIATSEIQNERGEPSLQRGDHVSAVVIVPENAEGRPVISINRARAEIGWRDLQTKKDAEEVVQGEVVDHNKGGLIVSVDGVRGFVPLSQIVELRRGGS